MDVRQRSSMKAPIQHIKIPSLAAMGSPITGVIKPYQKTTNHPLHSYYTKASDALPLPLKLTNAVFFTLFFSTVYYLLTSWREQIRNSTPLHVITISEIAALVTFVSSFIYLLGFFGMGFVFFTTKSSHDDVWTNEEEEEVNQALLKEDLGPCATAARVPSPKPKKIEIVGSIPIAEEDEEIIKSVVAGT